MNLVFDQGNTFLKCVLFNQGKMQNLQQFAYKNNAEWQFWLQEHKKLSHKAIYSGVGEDGVLNSIQKEMPNLLVLSPQTKVPFITTYKTPNTWGADRKALVMAAYTNYPGKAVLLIDVGSCVTFDFITENGVHQGGSIHPGLHMRAKAMQHFTARLPLVKIPIAVELSENSTESNLQSGVLNGFKFEIKATIDAYLARYPHMIALITGGDAKYLAEYVKNGIFAAPNLLLKGLNNILEYNAE